MHWDAEVTIHPVSVVALARPLLGAFTCTEVGAVTEWTPAQLATLKRIGARASLVLAKAAQVECDLPAMSPLMMSMT